MNSCWIMLKFWDLMVNVSPSLYRSRLNWCVHDSLSGKLSLFGWSALLLTYDHLCGFLPFAVFGRSSSKLTTFVMPSLTLLTDLLVPPTLSFSQFAATPLCSWVLSEKLFFTEPHRCQPMEAWEEDVMWWCTANVRHSQLHTSWRESTFREPECFYF